MYSDAVPGDQCVCGHERSAHRHFRSASDCALCAADVCVRYRPAQPVRSRIRRLLARLRRRPAGDHPSADETRPPKRSKEGDSGGGGSAVGL